MWDAGDVVCRFLYEGQGKRRPFIGTVLTHELNSDLSEGSLGYNGYFYVQDTDLPLSYTMSLYKTEKEPIETDISGTTTKYTYKYVFEYTFRVEVYRREQYEDTSQFGEDPEEGSVCFFPTHREKIWFRILADLSSGEDYHTITCIE